MPVLPFHISIIDVVIIITFVFQILWGAKLGFALATFALAGEILALVVSVLYSPSLASLINSRFGFVTQIDQFIADKTKIPPGQVSLFHLGQMLFEAVVFMALFFIIQTAFFQLGKFIHRQVGIRRMTYFSNSFFGMFIGAIRAILEVSFVLIAWNLSTRDPNIQQALQLAGSFTQFGRDSVLLPLFQQLVPAVSPFAKFF